MNKRALLIGLSYNGSSVELTGTINDVQTFKKLLIDIYGYNESEIFIMTDKEPKDSNLYPSKKNIIYELSKLVSNSSSGDKIVFFYSGHGIRAKNDECLYPAGGNGSTQRHNLLCDNEMRDIVYNIKKGVTFNIVLDCCHSQAIFDLHYYLVFIKKNEYMMKTSDAPAIDRAIVRMFSSCLTEQVSYDVKVENRLASGVFTRAIDNILRNKSKNITSTDLLAYCTQETEKYKQTPQMSFSNMSGVNTYFTL